MNWLYLFAFVAAIGPVLILLDRRPLAKGEEPPMIVQTGYFAIMIGVFGVLSQFMSFTAVMLIFVLVFGAIWALDKLLLEAKRGLDQREPVTIEYAKGFFPILLVIFLLRSFLVEPFQIPSSSMRPGLVVGDFILVNKYTYGLRIPVLNTVFMPVKLPQRGDVMVFHFPEDPKTDFIKRVIGLPGDTVAYQGKRLTINGQVVRVEQDGTYQYVDKGFDVTDTVRYQEFLAEQPHPMIVDDKQPRSLVLQAVRDFPNRENCTYSEDGFVCKVPDGHYFMMGDNRDNSHDSRYWGFVPDANIVGKAFLVWMNFGNLKRIGTLIE
ncbi:MAG: signal peptidase I [Chitinivorax sp.]